MIEQFVEGNDVTVPLLGKPLRALPPVLLTFDSTPLTPERTFTTDLKVSPLEGWIAIPPSLGEATKIGEQATTVASAMGCRDFARVDFRLTPDGRAFVLEVNTTPHLDPTRGPFAAAASIEERSFASILDELVASALTRVGHSQNHKSPIS